MTTTPPARPSRRNKPSISHLNLAPLSTFAPEDTAVAAAAAGGGSRTPPWRQSYIAGKSAPTTPGILSRSPSRTRARQTPGSRSYAQMPVFTDDVESGMKKPRPQRSSKKAVPAASRGDGEWLFRAGTAISDETRSSKGQAWLVNRASSTNLVDQQRESDDDDDEQDVDAPRIISPDTDRRQFLRSRPASRAASRTDLAALTPGYFNARGSRTSMHSGDEVDDYFGTRRDRRASATSAAAGPDFVDGAALEREAEHNYDEDDSDIDDEVERQAADEAEIRRLAAERGGVLDRFLSWALFPDREDEIGGGEDEDDDDAAAADQQDEHEKQTEEAARREAALGMLRNSRAPPAAGVVPEAGPRKVDGEGEGVSAWSDAAWLLSVASKVIF